jgi:L-asparagine permease
MVGITAGETKEPRKVMPKAVNSVMWRIALFYVGSVLLLAMVLPWTAYKAGESPFVTVFSHIGFAGAGDVMNLVVITAAMSSCNSGLYATGRILRSMALKGEAPAFAGTMSRRHVPAGGIMFTAAVLLAGVALYYFLPERAFNIAIAVSSLGVITTWGTFLYCQIKLREACLRGEIERPSFRMPGAPVTNWATLGFLGLIVVLMPFADEDQRIAFYLIPVLAIAIAVGWRAVNARRGLTQPVTDVVR